jgi:hypothetical protein
LLASKTQSIEKQKEIEKKNHLAKAFADAPLPPKQREE